MTCKTSIIVTMFVFTLSACAGNIETIQPTISIPTSTSTFTPEPTATLTPTPTTMLFQHTSCANPELMGTVRENAIVALGMSLDEYLEKIIALSKYDKSFAIFSEYDRSHAEYLLLGGAEISLSSLIGARQDDSAFCLYFVDDSDTYTIIPVIIAYTYQQKFYRISWVVDGWGEGASSFQQYSMSEVRTWWDDDANRPEIGDVFMMQYYSFSDVETPEQVALIETKKVAFPENTARLLKLGSDSYLLRIGGIISPVQAAKELNSIEGDIGLIPFRVALIEHNPLGK